jgi:hypothetical protein
MENIDLKINEYLEQGIHWKCVCRDRGHCITIYYCNVKEKQLLQFKDLYFLFSPYFKDT